MPTSNQHLSLRTLVVAALLLPLLAVWFTIAAPSSEAASYPTRDMSSSNTVTAKTSSTTLTNSTSISVSIIDFAYQPQNLTVTVNSQVTWTNNGMHNHTTTSDTGVWDSGTLSPGQSYSVTFTNTGVYTYHCSIHTFMTGTITVINTPITTTSSTYNLPFLANNYVPAGQTNGFTSYLAFQNTGTITANVALQYFDDMGKVITTPTSTCSTVAPYGECIAPNPFITGTKGTGVLTSTQPLNVVVSEATPYGGTAYAVSGVVSDELVAPLAINNSYGGFITQLNIGNFGTTPVTATVSFFNSDGSSASISSTKVISITSNTAITLDQTAQDSNLPVGFYGWAQITGTAGSKLVAQVLEQNPNNHFAALANAQAQTQSSLYAPAIFNAALGGFETGTNIVNPNSVPITVNISYYDEAGNISTTLPFTLTSHAVAPIYQGGTGGRGVPNNGLLPGFAGSAVVTTTGGGAVMVVNEQGGNTASGTARSGTYAAAGAGLSTIDLPTVANGGSGFTTGATILNTSSTSVSGTVQYYNADGTVVGTAKPFSVGPHASQLLYQGDPTQSLPSGFYGTAVISQTSGTPGSLIVTTNAQSSNFFYSYTEPSQ